MTKKEKDEARKKAEALMDLSRQTLANAHELLDLLNKDKEEPNPDKEEPKPSKKNTKKK